MMGDVVGVRNTQDVIGDRMTMAGDQINIQKAKYQQDQTYVENRIDRAEEQLRNGLLIAAEDGKLATDRLERVEGSPFQDTTLSQGQSQTMIEHAAQMNGRGNAENLALWGEMRPTYKDFGREKYDKNTIHLEKKFADNVEQLANKFPKS